MNKLKKSRMKLNQLDISTLKKKCAELEKNRHQYSRIYLDIVDEISSRK